MGCCYSKKISPEDSPEQIIVDTTTDTEKFKEEEILKNLNNVEKQKSINNRHGKTDKKDIVKLDGSLKDLRKGSIDLSVEIKEWVERIEFLSEKKHLESYVNSKKINNFRIVSELADFIKNGPGISDLEKYWMVFLWITENISYNRIGFNSGNLGENDADSVLRKGLAVCEGFSNLFSQICKFIGLECARISGYAKGVGYKIGDTFDSTNHAWNVITVEGKQYYVDSTWSCRRNNLDKTVKEWNPYWFMTPPKIFLESHLSPEIILHPKCSKQEFEKMHYFELFYHINGFKCSQIDGSFIKATGNPSILELTSKENCELLVELKDYDTDIRIDDAVTIQKDSTQCLKQKRPFKYCLIIDTSSNKTKYYLNIYGKNLEKKNQTNFTLLTKFILIPSDRLIQVNQLEKLIPAYNLTFLDNKLKLVSHKRKIIPLFYDKLVMEFEIDNSFEPLFNLNSLVTKNSLKDSIIVQCENASKFNKYCLIISIDNVKDKKYVLKVYAKNLKNNQTDYSLVTDFQLVLDDQHRQLNYKDFEKLIPAYNLTFLDNKLKLVSHKKILITNQLQILSLEFKADVQTVKLMAELKENGSTVALDNTTLIQTNPTNSHISVNVIFPDVNKIYCLQLLAKREDNFFYEFTKFTLFNYGSINRNIFISPYCIKQNFYVYEPIFKILKVNTKYKFKYYFESVKVAFFLIGRREIFLEKSEILPDVFLTEMELDQTGEMKLCIKYEFGSSYSTFCNYLVE